MMKNINYLVIACIMCMFFSCTNNDIDIKYANEYGYYKGELSNGRPEGIWFFYYPNGCLCETGNYKNGLKDGFWHGWDKTGQRTYSAQYKNNLHNGICVFFKDNKIYKYGSVEADKMVGFWITNYSESQKDTFLYAEDVFIKDVHNCH